MVRTMATAHGYEVGWPAVPIHSRLSILSWSVYSYTLGRFPASECRQGQRRGLVDERYGRTTTSHGHGVRNGMLNAKHRARHGRDVIVGDLVAAGEGTQTTSLLFPTTLGTWPSG